MIFENKIIFSIKKSPYINLHYVYTLWIPSIYRRKNLWTMNHSPLIMSDWKGSLLISTNVEKSLLIGCFHGSPSICIYASFHSPPLTSNLIAVAWETIYFAIPNYNNVAFNSYFKFICARSRETMSWLSTKTIHLFCKYKTIW